MRIIELEKVSKSYKFQKVLDGFSISINQGECILLIGTNGSGKTTLIRGILGFISFDSGTVRIRSNKISYVPEKFNFPDFITLKDFLKVLLSNYDNQMLNQVLEAWELRDAAEKSFHSFSKGMKQKTLLIQALYANADILVFDEPLSGLDNSAVNHFLHELKFLKEKGKTILIASHNPEKYHNLPDRIIEIEGVN
ncbi:MAG: ATP-binding cassette domain-containing protein [Bacilli bacterium]|nr:ATP-binding cassette domain-containing protein [Bacilli bacterium]